MDMSLLSQLHPAGPGFWIVFSLVIWAAIRLTQGHWSERQLRWLNMARWVLIPYAGLLAGSLSPRLMGLTGIDWRVTFSIGVVTLVGVTAVLAVIRLSLRDDSDISFKPGPDEKSIRPAAALTVLVAGAEQFHWSFLRGAVWEILLLYQNGIDLAGYWAAWIAALIVLPEILLQPLCWADRLLKVAILTITTALFILTRNFWLCWVFHAVAWFLLTPVPKSEQQGPSTSAPLS